MKKGMSKFFVLALIGMFVVSVIVVTAATTTPVCSSAVVKCENTCSGGEDIAWCKETCKKTEDNCERGVSEEIGLDADPEKKTHWEFFYHCQYYDIPPQPEGWGDTLYTPARGLVGLFYDNTGNPSISPTGAEGRMVYLTLSDGTKVALYPGKVDGVYSSVSLIFPREYAFSAENYEKVKSALNSPEGVAKVEEALELASDYWADQTVDAAKKRIVVDLSLRNGNPEEYKAMFASAVASENPIRLNAENPATSIEKTICQATKVLGVSITPYEAAGILESYYANDNSVAGDSASTETGEIHAAGGGHWHGPTIFDFDDFLGEWHCQ